MISQYFLPSLFYDVMPQSTNTRPFFPREKDFENPWSLLETMFDRKDVFQNVPEVTLKTTDKEYTLTAKLTAADWDKAKIELQNDSLVLSYEQKTEQKTGDKNASSSCHVSSSFERALPLPEDCDVTKITAQAKDDVLTITLPRKAAPKKTIAITRAA